MKAIILAGGFAKRMWPLTMNIPKPLLIIQGRPIIDYVVDKICELNEINEIIITINRRFEKLFKAWFKERRLYNSRLIVEKSMKEEEKPGAIAALANLIPMTRGEDVLIIAADNLFNFSLDNFMKFYKAVASPTIGVYDVGNPELVKRYASVKLDNRGRIIELNEKPENPASTLTAICLYALPNWAFNLLSEYINLGGNRDAPGYFIEWLYKKTDVYGYVFRGQWFDIGDIESYERAKREFKTR